MRVGDFGLFEDRRFVSGLVVGVGIGGLLGYGLGWERALAIGPGVMALPCLVLVGVGQWFAWGPVRRTREAAAGKPPDA